MAFTITRADIEKVFSSLAIDERIDDNNDGSISAPELSYLDDTIGDAVDEFLTYALRYYAESVLETSEWAKRQTAIIAAHALSTRRGNPDQFCTAYEGVIATLEMLGTKKWIPGAVPLWTPGPAMANLVIDPRRGESKVRVVPSTIVGGSHPTQETDEGFPYW